MRKPYSDLHRHNEGLRITQGLADGLTNKEVAASLGITYEGLVYKLRKIRAVYNLKTDAQLIAHYLRNGWID